MIKKEKPKNNLFFIRSFMIILYILMWIYMIFIKDVGIIEVDHKQGESLSYLAKTMISGGDLTSHNYIVHYVEENFPKFRWWSADWFSGFPMLYFYPPLAYIVTLFLSLFMPIALSFKVLILAIAFLFPFCFFWSTKWAGFRSPMPEITFLAGSCIFFSNNYWAFGGTLYNVLLGQFSHTASIAFLFIFLGLVIKGLRERKYLVWNIILGSSTMLLHPVSGILLISLLPFYLYFYRKRLEDITYVFLVYLGIFLITSFWTLGLVFYSKYANNIRWFNEIVWQEFLPFDMWFLLLGGMVGLLLALFYKRREAFSSYIFLFIFAILVYVFVQRSFFVNGRFLPYIHYVLAIFFGFFISEAYLLIKKRNRPLAIGVMISIFIVMGSVVFLEFSYKNNSYLLREDLRGIQSKQSWEKLEPVYSYMNELRPGRVAWELSKDYKDYGITRTFENIPLYSGKKINSGLLIESSVFINFDIINSGEMSDTVSHRTGLFKYPHLDIEKGLNHLRLTGVRYIVVFSDRVKSEVKQHKDLSKLKDIGDFSVYEIEDVQLVVPLADLKVVEKREDWLEKSLEWYKNGDLGTPLVFSENKNQEIHLKKIQMPSSEVGVVSNIVEGNDSVEFDVTQINKPYLVKISYFPTWKVTGAKGPYLISPSYMMVVPTQKHVKLYFSYGWVDWTGIGLSGLGLVYLVFVGRIDEKINTLIDKSGTK